jgi:hypothetical protein
VQGSQPTADLERCSDVGPALQPDESAPDGWPLSSYLEFSALPAAVARARLHARNLLWEWGSDWLAAETELLASELVTNAVKATMACDRPTGIRPGRTRPAASSTAGAGCAWSWR